MSNTPRGAAPHNSQIVQPHLLVQQPTIITSPIIGSTTSPVVNSNIIGNKRQPPINLMYNAPTLVTTVTSSVHSLVSYHDDTVVSDDEGGGGGVTFITTTMIGQPMENGRLINVGANEQQQQEPSPTSGQDELISDGEMDTFGVVIPPEPIGICPLDLQDKITALFKKMETGGLDMNKVIQQRKDFRNPSIYEKLIQYCKIDELGSNYPPERFDPCKWGKDSYYEELANVQMIEMEKLKAKRKEKGTKMEIISGLAKRPSSSITTADEDAKKRKSKWDQVATGATAASAASTTVSKATLPIPLTTFTTLTPSVTGTKATVISAFGSLPKKRL
ncbi:SAP30-binding protein isoform X2 [Leptopilina boulardi]|nr:SAP30-binding protein isoform X2 [Leptopilina boulardi]